VTVVAAERHDPLRTYRFRVSIGGRAVAGVQKVSGLTVAVGVRETWEGGNALHRYANPDRATWEPITLHQGLALGDTLERWATAVVDYLRTGRSVRGAVKRDVVIDVLEDRWPPKEGPAPRSYLVRNAWISKYEAVPALDAMANEVALISLELTHEGWKAQHEPAAAPTPPASSPELRDPFGPDARTFPPGTAIA
jgi:phage tail-like protein